MEQVRTVSLPPQQLSLAQLHMKEVRASLQVITEIIADALREQQPGSRPQGAELERLSTGQPGSTSVRVSLNEADAEIIIGHLDGNLHFVCDGVYQDPPGICRTCYPGEGPSM